MLKILATDGLDKSAIKELEDLGNKVDVKFYEVEELKSVLREYDVLIVRSATKVRVPVIDAVANSKLKLIIRAGVGIDNIDYKYAREKGIEVSNTPNSNSASVAELVLGHMFTLARYIHLSNITMKKGEWNKKNYTGIELNGKTLGLVGFGKIANILAKKAEALGMKVIYYKRSGKIENCPYSYVSFEELLNESDFISLHIPSPEKPVMDASAFSKMKKTAYLINTARGNAISEIDLVNALNNNEIAGAALDVFLEEPTKNLDIINHPKISLTPHIGASTFEAQERVGGEVVEVIKNFFKI